MIIVVEGISAAGKTTWCQKHAPTYMLPETGSMKGAPDRDADPQAAADFWVTQNSCRWDKALKLERSLGVAVCDTDPLKLHYVWSLWQIGVASEQTWQFELTAMRDAFRERRIGFADRYLVKMLDEATARQQRENDPTRTRRNFELHLRLQASLVAWYAAIEAVMPGSVIWEHPTDGLLGLSGQSESAGRHDLGSFDAAVTLLSVTRP